MGTKSIIQTFAGQLKEHLKEIYTARREIERLRIQRGILTDEIIRLTKICEELVDDLESNEHE